jgi:hypothetical protein
VPTIDALAWGFSGSSSAGDDLSSESRFMKPALLTLLSLSSLAGCGARSVRVVAPTSTLPAPIDAAAPVAARDASVLDSSAPIALPAWARGASPWSPFGFATPTVIASDARETVMLAGNVRVRVDAQGTVSVGEELTASTIASATRNGAGWTFVTRRAQVLLASDFAGTIARVHEMPDAVIAVSRGEVPAVRRDDGRWWRVDAQTPTALPTLGDTVYAAHLRASGETFALRTPGVVLRGAPGATELTPLPWGDDLPLDLHASREDGGPVIQGLRRRARWAVGTWVEDVSSDASDRDRIARARAAWESWWRRHLWPEGRSIELTEGSERVTAMEHRGALYWLGSGRLGWLTREGVRGSRPLPVGQTCDASPFGSRVLLHCVFSVEAGRTRDGLWMFDPTSGAITEWFLDPRISANRIVAGDGSAVVIGLVDAAGVHRSRGEFLVWTTTRPWRVVSLPAVMTSVHLVDGKLVIGHDASLSIFDLHADTIVGRRVQRARDGRAVELPGPSVVQVDARGRIAAITWGAERRDDCALYRGSWDAPLARVEVPRCRDIARMHMTDDRFGVVVFNDNRGFVTRDGGAGWEPLPPDGAEPVESFSALRRSLVLVSDGAEFAIGTHRRVQRDVFPAGERPLWIARARRMDEHAFEPEEDVLFPDPTIPCGPLPRETPLGGVRVTDGLRSWKMFSERARVDVSLTRGEAQVSLSLSWTHEGGGRGRFEGAAPWPNAELDFDRGPAVGYGIRGGSPAGVLLERCVFPAEDRDHLAPTRCDAYWFDRGGRAVLLALQRPLANGGGARIELAAPDGLGWVLQLSPASNDAPSSWTQWQHWSEAGTLSRWGDSRSLAEAELYGALARIGGVWGTIEGLRDGVPHTRRFHPHGATEGIALETPAEVSLCARRPGPTVDRWWHVGRLPFSGAVVRGAIGLTAVPTEAQFTLAREGDRWCVERAQSVWVWSEHLFPSSDDRSHVSWWREAPRPAGSGRTGWIAVDEDGNARASPVQCAAGLTFGRED